MATTDEDEQKLKVIQTAAGFAERIVKEHYAAHLDQSAADVFGDAIGGPPGVCTLKARERSQARDFTLSLGIVPHDHFDENIRDVAQIESTGRALMSLICSAEIYHQYLMAQLPPDRRTELVRSTRGTLSIKGAAATSQHIGIIMKPSEESSADDIHNGRAQQWTPKSPK